MARIRSELFLSRVHQNDFTRIKLKGVQDGTFCLLLEAADGTFILENENGSMKTYPKTDHALTWLRRMTNLTEVTVDIEIWRSDER
jgi:hypothetical protein